jgi:nucleoside-diphosphate-sugar epimerase
MRVLVTGASGFVGSHVVAGLLDSGHTVRAFARSRSKLDSSLAAVGAEVDEVTEGDVTDQEAVSAAMRGVDAVVHAANVYTYDPRRSQIMMRTAVEGTRNVLDAAVSAGCDPIVHVSTGQVSWPRDQAATGSPPLSPMQGLPYSDSKKAAEAIARSWQDRGAPVVTTYPGGILGPDDPGPGEQILVLRSALVPTAPFRIDGGFPLCDIDWITALHVALVDRGRGPRRVTCTGAYVTWDEWFRLVREATGRPIPRLWPTPSWALASTGRLMDGMQRVAPVRLPFGREVAWILQTSYAYPDEEARDLVGPPPPPEETISKAIGWAAAAGHVTARQAGSLAPTGS